MSGKYLWRLPTTFAARGHAPPQCIYSAYEPVSTMKSPRVREEESDRLHGTTTNKPRTSSTYSEPTGYHPSHSKIDRIDYVILEENGCCSLIHWR